MLDARAKRCASIGVGALEERIRSPLRSALLNQRSGRAGLPVEFDESDHVELKFGVAGFPPSKKTLARIGGGIYPAEQY
jgi:hypothetical protein